MIVRLKAYALADRFLDFNFGKATAQSIVDQTNHYLWYPREIVEFVTWAFENVPFRSPILQLKVNEFCHFWDEYCLDGYDVRALHEMPLSFTFRVVLRLRERLHWPDGMEHEEACYLEHISEDETEACSKLHHVKYDESTDYGNLREVHDMFY